MMESLLPLLCRLLPRSRRGGVRILLFHEIREERLEMFRRLVLFIRERYLFIAPAEYESHLGADKPVYLISFDDGFSSQVEAARTVLDPLGIKALFFVCTGGVGLRGENALDYIIRRMGRSDVKELFPHLELPAWGDLAQLASRGHVIGSHTMNHARLSQTTDQTAKVEEIIRSGDEIEKRLGIKVEWFSYPFGDIASIDTAALKIIGTRYRYCCSGVRGINRTDTNRLCILRENADAERSKVCMRQAALGALDFYYCSRRKKLREMAGFVRRD
jgi:peptidoglycan/xylan/chitin deacetylase (PgdA/CDA1 family)